MSRFVWTKKRSIITITLITILAVSSFGFWQTSNNVQAAILDPHPGLVGWWRFDEGSGTVASDSSGNGNTGTINGATWVDGKYGKALSFAGTNSQYVSTAYSLPSSGALTVSMWVNLPQLASIYGNNVGFNTLFYQHIANNYIYCGGTNDYFRVSLSTNIWYNLVLVIPNVTNDASSVLYVNGIAVPIVQQGGSHVFSTGNFEIGKSYSFFFNGIIDEARIYNRALSQAEIQDDLNIGPNFSANVLAKVPQGTTQIITTLSWQGAGNINITIVSPSQNYTENMLSEYQKSSYSISNGITSMLNIKRLSVSVTALPSDQNWYMVMALDKVEDYQITVEVQK